jgi:dienelactone hydrolase
MSTYPPVAEVSVAAAGVVIEGNLFVPDGARGVVVFAHGSGSSRNSPRNRLVAASLNEAGFGTLLLDLLTASEDETDRATGQHRFDIGLLAGRVTGAVDWLRGEGEVAVPLGLFGASTGAAAALVTAADRPEVVAAVVSRGGRPDLAGVDLGRVLAPTLLIVGGADPHVLELNRRALQLLRAPIKELAVVPGASHLFEEPGTLEDVAGLAADWFTRHLAGSSDAV